MTDWQSVSYTGQSPGGRVMWRFRRLRRAASSSAGVVEALAVGFLLLLQVLVERLGVRILPVDLFPTERTSSTIGSLFISNLHQFLRRTDDRRDGVLSGVYPLDNQFHLSACDVRAIPRNQVIHAVPNRQGQVVGICPSFFRQIDSCEIPFGQITDLRQYFKDSEGRYSIHTFLRRLRVALGYFLQHHRRYERLQLRESQPPPLGRHLLMGGDDRNPGSLGLSGS